MMLRYSFNLKEEADAIENSVKDFLEKGYRTADIAGAGRDGVPTEEAGRSDRVVHKIKIDRKKKLSTYLNLSYRQNRSIPAPDDTGTGWSSFAVESF